MMTRPCSLLKARKRSQKVLEKVYEAEEATEEKALDWVMELGLVYMWMDDGECKACFERAKEGLVCLLGENCAKAVHAAYRLVGGSADEMITEYRRLWERAKVSLPDEAVTSDLAKRPGK